MCLELVVEWILLSGNDSKLTLLKSEGTRKYVVFLTVKNSCYENLRKK